MKYSLLIAGLVFLFNPEYSFFDILPDFIGLLMIARAIEPLTDISPSAENAAKCFKKAALASGIQCAFLLPMMSITAIDNACHLVFTFAGLLARMLFLLPAFKDFFASLRYFSDKHAVKTKVVDLASTFTSLFVFSHTLLTVLPQCVYLQVQEFGIRYPLTADRTSHGMTTYQELTHFSIILTFVLGTIWLVALSSCLLSLKRNKALNHGIAADIAVVPHSVTKTVLRSAKPAIYLLIFAAFATVACTVDGLPLLPPLLAPILYLLAIRRMERILTPKRRIPLTLIFAASAGIALHLALYEFCSIHHETALYNFAQVKTAFLLPLATEILYCILMIASQLCLRSRIRRLIVEHTGIYWENAYISHNARIGKEKQRQLFFLDFSTVLFCLLLISNSVSYYYLYLTPTYRLINTGFGVFVASLGASLYASILSSIQDKYSDALMKE